VVHLVHPVLVHFAIAFLVAGAAVEVWGLLAGREAPVRFGGTLVLLGTLALLPTIVAGYLAANGLDLTAEQVLRVESHERSGLLLLAPFVAALFWKGWFRGTVPRRYGPFYAALLFAGLALAAYTAYLGGELVYGMGVGVAAR